MSALHRPPATLSDPILWARLRDVSFDEPGADLPFSARLARDNGWTDAFAQRAIEEYRRFAYLCVVAGAQMTPSDEVDQVWHLHLVYTRHYWGPFTKALGTELHHGPTLGGASEGQRFRRQYADTLATYEREFGAPPPADIWPREAVRFGKAPTARRVLTADHWVVRKPARWVQGLTGGALIAALLVPAIGYAHDDFPDELTPGTITKMVAHWYTDHTAMSVVITVILVIALIGLLAPSSKNKSRDGGGCGTGGGDGDGGGSGCGSGCGGCGG